MTSFDQRLAAAIPGLRPIRPGRVSAAHEDEFVVFVLGARAHKLWRPDVWVPVATSFVRMIRWLERHPAEGLLGSSYCWVHGSLGAIQYWSDYDSLERFARNRDALHLPRWQWYRKAVERPGHLGIWHETYTVRPGTWESIYVNMPLVGLAAATSPVGTAQRGESSRERRGQPVVR